MAGIRLLVSMEVLLVSLCFASLFFECVIQHFGLCSKYSPFTLLHAFPSLCTYMYIISHTSWVEIMENS